ncbi:hypothetical protein NVP1176O_10 [Vibrio phage 1.176.O._10N.261.55.F5]|nr:hypothetical protein NVP1176O_10 [Vibrio phage 1.176.O._10N.261.55.F5]
MAKSILVSNDIFHDLCDLLRITKSEREGIVSMDVHLPNLGAVTYEVEKEIYFDPNDKEPE